MPATAARIGFIQQEFRRATATVQAVKDRYGSLARQSDDPIPTSFDEVADAQAIADARQAMQSGERRRFQATVRGLDDALALDYEAGAVPVLRFTDRERDADRKVVVTDIVIDFAAQRATLSTWG